MPGTDRGRWCREVVVSDRVVTERCLIVFKRLRWHTSRVIGVWRAVLRAVQLTANRKALRSSKDGAFIVNGFART